MAYVIYEKESTKILSIRARSVGCYKTSFKSEAAAKAALTRQAKKGSLDEGLTKEDYAIAEARDFYDNIEKKEIRHGVAHAHGKKYEVGVNTPWTSGPWSETYHCS